MKFLLPLLWCLSAHAATYYVAKTGSDSNTGFLGSPWLTVQKAANTMSAGDTVNIATGTYAETVTVSTSGTSGNKITYSGPGSIQRLVCPANYITFTNVTFYGNNDPVVQWDGAYASILKCRWTGQTMKGMNLNSNNSVVDSCDFTGGNTGVVGMSTGGTNMVVQNTTMHDQDNPDAFAFLWGVNVQFINNNMLNCDNSRYDLVHGDFLQVFAYNPTATSSNIVVSGNRVLNCNVQCFFLNASNTGQGQSPNIRNWYIHNNIFANSWQSGGTYVPYTQIANNLWTNWGTANGYSFNIRAGTGDPYSVGVGCTVNNNVFLGTGYVDEVSGLAGDYNFRSSGALPSGTHNIIGVNPQFNLATQWDYTLKSTSPLIGAGLTLTSFNTDISGLIRTVPWDIGPNKYGNTVPPVKPSAPRNFRLIP